MPATDLHARAALLYYAGRIANENPELAGYLRAWVRKLYEGDSPTARVVRLNELPAWLYEQEHSRREPSPPLGDSDAHDEWVRNYVPGVRQPYNSGDSVSDGCPRCSATERQIKIGKTSGGSRRFKCQLCKKRYTPKDGPA